MPVIRIMNLSILRLIPTRISPSDNQSLLSFTSLARPSLTFVSPWLPAGLRPTRSARPRPRPHLPPLRLAFSVHPGPRPPPVDSRSSSRNPRNGSTAPARAVKAVRPSALASPARAQAPLANTRYHTPPTHGPFWTRWYRRTEVGLGCMRQAGEFPACALISLLSFSLSGSFTPVRESRPIPPLRSCEFSSSVALSCATCLIPFTFLTPHTCMPAPIPNLMICLRS